MGSRWGQDGVKMGSRWGQHAPPYLERLTLPLPLARHREVKHRELFVSFARVHRRVSLEFADLGDLCGAFHQGLTLVHFSAQLERCLWDRGCA